MVHRAKGEAEGEGGGRKSLVAAAPASRSPTEPKAALAPGAPSVAPPSSCGPPSSMSDGSASPHAHAHAHHGHGLGARATAMLRSLEAKVDAAHTKEHLSAISSKASAGASKAKTKAKGLLGRVMHAPHGKAPQPKLAAGELVTPAEETPHRGGHQ